MLLSLIIIQIIIKQNQHLEVGTLLAFIRVNSKERNMVESISTLNELQNVRTFSSREDKNAIGRDGFMRLLLAQLRNQDPQNPLQSHEFAAQLAQFTSVEQLFKINENLDRNLELDLKLSQSIGNSLATTVVGKNLRAIGNQISLRNGSTSEVYITLPTAVSNVVISIYDSNGTLVRKEDLDIRTSGDHTYVWDGKNNDDGDVADGIYTFSVNATNNSGASIPISFFMGGHITGVKFNTDNATMFLVGDLNINVSDVVMITEPDGG